jgi:hypothetical protein
MYTGRYYVICLVLYALDLCHTEISLDQKCVFLVVTFQEISMKIFETYADKWE